MPTPEFSESGWERGSPRNLHREGDGRSSQQGQSESMECETWGNREGGRHGACQDICEIFAFHMEKFMTDPVTILPKSMDRSECQSSNLGKGED